MKLYLYATEWYPVVVPQKDGDANKSAEFTSEELMEIKRVFREFNTLQTVLFKKFDIETYHVASEDLEYL